jgi:hypothetical protein
MAIPLLWFRDEKLVASIITGCKVMALNWRAFGMLALVLVLLLIPVAALMAVLFSIAGSAGVLSVLVAGLVMLIALAFQLVVFGTQFCAFRDIYDFAVLQPEVGDSEGGDGQLLA